MKILPPNYFFKDEVGVEESIVNTPPLVSLHSNNTKNAKCEVRFKQVIRDL
jgi:hypothetical protein